MARIRSIKPEFWVDRRLAQAVSRDARLLYIGLWNLADEHSRLHGDERYVKGQVFPYDDELGLAAIRDLLTELERAGRVVRYDVDGEPYLFLPKLDKHQRLEATKVPSRLPAPPGAADPSASAGESESRADESAPGVDESPLLYVAGSREQVAGEGSATEPPRADVEAICTRLSERMLANGCKEPKITQKWRDAARLMLDRDNRPLAELLEVLDWCQADQFWRSNIQSVPTFREKFDKLRLQMTDRRAPPGHGHQPFRNPTDPDAYGGTL